MKNKVTVEDIDATFQASTFEDVKLGAKSTVVCCTMPNGFEIIESSSCVDPANYDHQKGVDICHRRIKDRMWLLLGFLMQHQLWINRAEVEPK